MAVTTVPERELDEGLEMLAKSEAKAIYVVDSFGALYSEKVHYLVEKYLRYCKSAGKEVGVHMHNNLQLAFANTIEGIIMGANLPRRHHGRPGPRRGQLPDGIAHRLSAQSEVQSAPGPRTACRTRSSRCASKLLWGYDLPYLLTGMLNQHPRTAIKFKEAELKGEKGDILEFYDTVTE